MISKDNIPDVIARLDLKYGVLERLRNQNKAFLNKTIACDNVRLSHSLLKSNIYTFQDFLDIGIENVLQQPGCGRKTAKELFKFLDDSLTSFEKLKEQIRVNDLNGVGSDEAICTERDKFVQTCRDELSKPNYLETVHLNKSFLKTKNNLFNILYSGMKDHLDDRQLHIFYDRHCVENPLTLQQLGQSMGLTRERIRQIDEKACKKIAREFFAMSPTDMSSINSFYLILNNLSGTELISFVFYVFQERDVIHDIVETILVSEKVVSSDSPIFKKTIIEPHVKARIKTPEDLKTLKKIKFMKSVCGYDSMEPATEKFVEAVKNHNIKPSKQISRFFSRVTKNKDNLKLVGTIAINGRLFDAALILLDKYIVLIECFQIFEDFLSSSTIEKERADREFCLKNKFGCSYICSRNRKSFNFYRSLSLKPEIENDILSFVENNSNGYSHTLKFISGKFKTTQNKLIGLAIRHSLLITFNPLAIWKKNQTIINHIQTFDKENGGERGVEQETSKTSKAKKQNLIDEYSFSEEEITIVSALCELQFVYLGRRKRMAFGTIKVFINGYKLSYLYDDCHNLEFFGCLPHIRHSYLQETLDKFVEIGLLSQKTVRNKLKYRVEEKALAKSKLIMLIHV